jgi:hypothetical protein
LYKAALPLKGVPLANKLVSRTHGKSAWGMHRVLPEVP